MQNNERRDYYRIEDQVALAYEVLAPDTAIPEQEAVLSNSPALFRLLYDLNQLDTDAADILRQIASESQATADYLKLLNQKLLKMGQYVVNETLSSEHKLLKISLSAGGVSFPINQELKIGDMAKLEIILQPECLGIVGYAKVVACRENDTQQVTADQMGSHIVAMEYVRIRESDRDRIVRHVLQTQSTQLRQQKNDTTQTD